MLDVLFDIVSFLVTVFVRAAIAAIIIFVLAVIFRAIRRFTVDRLQYERHFVDECVYEGDTTELMETIWNPTPFIVLFADVESYFYSGLSIENMTIAKGDMRHFVSRYHLLPFEKITRRIAVECVKRGYYKLTSVSIYRCGDKNHIDSHAEIYVYPKIDETAARIPGAYGLGDELSQRKLIRNPFSVNGIREYQQGDSFRDINFKISARLSVGGNPRFAVNRYDYCSNSKYYIYQNFHLQKESKLIFDDYEELMELGLRFSASLLVKAIESGGTCAFSANCATVRGDRSVIFPMRAGEVHKRDILREMALTRAIDGVSFTSILASDLARGIYNSEIFIITSFIDETMSAQIAMFERMGNAVKVIMLGGETE